MVVRAYKKNSSLSQNKNHTHHEPQIRQSFESYPINGKATPYPRPPTTPGPCNGHAQRRTGGARRLRSGAGWTWTSATGSAANRNLAGLVTCAGGVWRMALPA